MSLSAAALACDRGPTQSTPPIIALNSVTPDTLVEGRSATLRGSGFSATPSDNVVKIGSLSATVTSATTTSLTVTVPQASCRPEGPVDVRVTVGGATSSTITTWLRPDSFLNLAVGEQVIIQDPEQFCLQFPASAAGDDAYLIGVGSTVLPEEVIPFTMTGVPGASAATAMRSPRPLAVPASTRRTSGGVTSVQEANSYLSQLRSDVALRRWERELFQGAGPWGRLMAQRAAPRLQAGVVLAVGDTIRFKVPGGSATVSPCDTFVPVTTVVRVVGEAGIWVTDTANPVTDALSLAEIQSLSDTFDAHIYPVDTTYFGPLSDIDLNQRVYIVLTIEVNRQGSRSIVFGGDLYFDRAFCTQSNGGEIIYNSVPDPDNVAGSSAQSKSTVLDGMPSVLAHQLTHNMQLSRRFNGTFIFLMTLWEMEGQAMLAEEVVGHSVLGNRVGQNYGASVAFAPGGSRWYQRPLQQLASYYGWLPPGTTAKAADAPELCTLLGEINRDTNCDALAFQGASWSLMRYLADRFGPTYRGGEAGLNRDLIGEPRGVWGGANIESVVGADFDTLFAQWAATLYVDGRGASSKPPLTMSSWDLLDVFNAFGSDAFRLIPPERTFTSFRDARAVRGGSSAYTRLSAAGPHPAFAVRVRDATDAVLNRGMDEQLWVVRLQ